MLCRRIATLGRAAVLGALVLTLAACEEDITAVVGTDLPYSIYGVISPQLDSQWVRVYPIEGRLVPAEPEPLDAVVTSTDRTTGEKVVWRDSIIVDFADQYAHVYWAPFQAEYDHAYQISVRAPDGAETSVEVSVPKQAEIVLEQPLRRQDGVFLPVLVAGPVPRVIRVEVDYSVAYLPLAVGDIIQDQFTIPYHTEAREVEGGWRIPINLRDDYDEIRATISETGESLDLRVGIILLNITLRLIVANEEWNPPDGQFDPELLVQPGVMTNVGNGFGFVGAGYRMERAWIPPDEFVEDAGFRAQEESSE